MEKIRVGIIGTGLHGSRYAKHIINDVEGLELTAVSRRSAMGREQAVGWQAAYFQDWQDLVTAPEVDAVLAVTFPSLNLQIAEKCLEAGKPLLVEKPLAVDVEAAGRMEQLVHEQGLKITVGQTLRYNNIVRSLRDNLHALGPLYHFAANQRLEPSQLYWHDLPEHAGAGVTFHTAVHVFDALRFITGREIKRVMAVSQCRHSKVLEDMLVIMVELDDGVVGVIDCSKVGHARTGRFEFVGENGQLHGDQIHDQLEVVKGTEVLSLAHEQPVNTILPLLDDWYQYLVGLGDNPISVEAGRRAVQACEACLTSARIREWVNVV